MRKMNASRRALLLAAPAILALPGAARAQAWAPTRPIRLVVAYPPGGATDLVARWVARELTPRLGQPVVVENRPGASGNIGADAVARATPDGHTLLVHTTTLVMNASLYRSLPYNPLRSFASLTAMVDVDYALVLHASGGASMAELLARARSGPGVLNYASPGVGTPHHLVDGREHDFAHMAEVTGILVGHGHDHAQVGFGSEFVEAQGHPGSHELTGPARQLQDLADGRARVDEGLELRIVLEDEVLAQREGEVVRARALHAHREGLEQAGGRHAQRHLRVMRVDAHFSQDRVDGETASRRGLAPAAQSGDRHGRGRQPRMHSRTTSQNRLTTDR